MGCGHQKGPQHEMGRADPGQETQVFLIQQLVGTKRGQHEGGDSLDPDEPIHIGAEQGEGRERRGHGQQMADRDGRKHDEPPPPAPRLHTVRYRKQPAHPRIDTVESAEGDYRPPRPAVLGEVGRQLVHGPVSC